MKVEVGADRDTLDNGFGSAVNRKEQPVYQLRQHTPSSSLGKREKRMMTTQGRRVCGKEIGGQGGNRRWGEKRPVRGESQSTMLKGEAREGI